MLVFIGFIGQVFAADIIGQAFLKTKGGDIKTCAGNEVYLELSSGSKWLHTLIMSERAKRLAYSAAYLSELNEKLGKDNTDTLADMHRFTDDYKKYSLEHIKANKKSVFTTLCDAQGNFEFKNIKNGKYLIATKVEWEVGDETQGGLIDKILDINQKKQKVILTE